MNNNYHNIENIFVIGDVHGCFFTLKSLIKKLPKSAQLIFVGDLCDKGNFSKDVIEFVISNNHACIKGNHEHLFEKYILNAVQKNIHSPWSSDKRYGGLQCIQSYNNDISLIKKHLEWIKNLPTYIQIDKYFITHGFALEFYEKKDDKDYYNDFLLNRIYEDTIEPKIKDDVINIFGHCVFEEVKKGKKYICLDTGCSNGGKLSAIQLGTQNIIQEAMDKRDSSYTIKELKLKDIDKKDLKLKNLKAISLKENCKYNSFDIVSNEVLEHLVKAHPKEALEVLSSMKKKSIIFPKQINKVLNISN